MLFKELNETRDQLDISILSADKVIKTKSDIENLLNTEVTIEHKTDGTKLTVIHVADNGDIGSYMQFCNHFSSNEDRSRALAESLAWNIP